MHSAPATLTGLPAPAKLNLFLHVLGRREDGYHNLQSAFMLIDWQDKLNLTRTTNGRLTRTEEGVCQLPEKDLCIRAAEALQQATRCPYGVHIHVRKRIPAQAGMGGGSSDAATVLLGLNRLWETHLPLDALMRIGLQLGADVPFFLFGHNAWAEGVGERLQAIDLPPARWVIVIPPEGVATADIFSAADLPRATPHRTLHEFINSPRPLAFGHNDLQTPAARLCPVINQAIAWLAEHKLSARMTGSGSGVFAQLPAETDAEILQQRAPKNWIVRVCNNLPEHPLLQYAA